MNQRKMSLALIAASLLLACMAGMALWAPANSALRGNRLLVGDSQGPGKGGGHRAA